MNEDERARKVKSARIDLDFSSAGIKTLGMQIHRRSRQEDFKRVQKEGSDVSSIIRPFGPSNDLAIDRKSMIKV